MQKFLSRQKISNLSVLLMAATLVILAGCGSGTPSSTSGTGAGSVTTPLTPTPTLTLALTNASGTPVTSVSNGASANVNATVRDAAGILVPSVVVTFSTSPTMATMNPPTGTALTNGSGVASITLTGGATAGATTISASAQVGSAAVTGSVGYTVGSTSVTISTLLFGLNPLSAFGTTSVTATVTGGGTGSQVVNFTSVCAGQTPPKAILSTGITTVGGVAVASYRDSGCATTDTITATVNGGLASLSAPLTVTPPTIGSIRYVSSVPTNISLKGTGGTESSQVTFEVLDTGGKPLSGKSVTFSLSTTLGGITLTPASGVATSDASGLVVTGVNAGTFSTPVRVTATTTGVGGVPISTQSSQLTITTGIPDQFGFSLAASTHNIEGWSVDGTTSVLTASMADHFKNPVPDGTGVVFTAEAGTIIGSCTTVNGACSAIYTSGGTRPASSVNGFGRVTVLAYVLGEETFTDYSGDGWADLSPNEMFDPIGNPTDLPEAWVDYNENDIYDAGAEPFVSSDGDTIYDPADNQFSGVLCDHVTAGRSSPGTCSINKTVHVRQSQTIVLSSSFANITINAGSAVVVPPCSITNGNVPTTFTVTVVDVNGNAMPAGTTVAFTTDNGTLSSATSYIVPDTTGCRNGYPGCPTSAASTTFGNTSVTMKSDATYTVVTPPPNTCANSTPSGTFRVTVTSPKGGVTIASVTITD